MARSNKTSKPAQTPDQGPDPFSIILHQELGFINKIRSDLLVYFREQPFVQELRYKDRVITPDTLRALPSADFEYLKKNPNDFLALTEFMETAAGAHEGFMKMAFERGASCNPSDIETRVAFKQAVAFIRESTKAPERLASAQAIPQIGCTL